jgi:hypothetical protein
MELASSVSIGIDSSFIDLGCSYGLLLIAAIKMGYQTAYGVELFYEPVRWFNVNVARILESEHLLLRTSAIQRDILDWNYNDYVNTHVYSFDKDWTSKVLAHVLYSVAMGVRWKLRVWATAHSLANWKSFFGRHCSEGGLFMDEKKYGESHRKAILRLLTEELSLYTTCLVPLCSSGERHTIYVFTYKAV